MGIADSTLRTARGYVVCKLSGDNRLMSKVAVLREHRPGKMRIDVGDVAGALNDLGGVAHRDLIVQRVLHAHPHATAYDKAEILFQVDACLVAAEQRKNVAISVRRVFGEASNRWSLMSS